MLNIKKNKNIMKTKKLLRILILTVFAISAPMLINNAFADDPPLPPASHGQSGNQPTGGGAPIGSGIIILLSLGAGYGAKKIYDVRKKLSTKE